MASGRARVVGDTATQAYFDGKAMKGLHIKLYLKAVMDIIDDRFILF